MLYAVVLSKIKVSFNATVVRLEHVPKDSETGMSLEVRIARYAGWKTLICNMLWNLCSYCNVTFKLFILCFFMVQLSLIKSPSYFVDLDFCMFCTVHCHSVFMFVSFFVLSCHTAYVSYYCNTVGWTWWDWSLISRTFLQCFDTVGWVTWSVKTRPRYDL